MTRQNGPYFDENYLHGSAVGATAPATIATPTTVATPVYYALT